MLEIMLLSIKCYIFTRMLLLGQSVASRERACSVPICFTLGPGYNEQIDAKKTARCRRVLMVAELFNIAVNDFDTKKSTCCKQVFVVSELVVSGTQCIIFFTVL